MKIEVECFANGHGQGFSAENKAEVLRKMTELGFSVDKPDDDPEILHSGPHANHDGDLLQRVEQLTKLTGVRFVNVFFSQE
jgi:hypothetical protein